MPEQDPKKIEDQTPRPEMIEKAKFDEVSKDLHKFKAELKTIKDQQEQSNLQAMKEKQDWQKIAELKEQESVAAKQKLEQIQESYLYDKKYSALKENAIKAGIVDEDLLKLMPIDEIAVETTSMGGINILGAQQLVEKYKAQKPLWFQKAKAPNININDPTMSMNGDVTIQMVLEAQKKDPVNYPKLLKEFQKQKYTKRS